MFTSKKQSVLKVSALAIAMFSAGLASAQQTMPQPSAPPTELPPLPSEFETGVKDTLPLTPEQIRYLRAELDRRQKAASDLPNPPKSVTGSISVPLSPGATPPIVRPFFGVSTSITILDSSGSVWPVENFSIGNKTLFQVDRLDGAQGSTFIISPTQSYGQSNMIFKLAGLSTPVVINLVSGQKIHDARVEARIQALGPNATVSSTPMIKAVDSRLLSVLDGVPPAGRQLKVKGDQSSSAWITPDGRVWLRTRLKVVSPAPLSFVSSSDGTHVYELTSSSSVLVMSGTQFSTITLDGCMQECSQPQGGSK